MSLAALEMVKSQLEELRLGEARIIAELEKKQAEVKVLIDEVHARDTKIATIRSEIFSLKQILSRTKRNLGSVAHEIVRMERAL